MLSRIVSGVLATLVLGYFERLEWRALGRVPVYAPSAIARRLFPGLPTLSGRATPELRGQLLRWTYGPALGLLLSGMLRRRPAGVAGLAVGTTIYLFEIIAMPHVRATPPLRRWRAAEVVSLFVHTGVFGLVLVTAFRVVARRRRHSAGG